MVEDNQNKKNKALNFMKEKKANGAVSFIMGIVVIVMLLATAALPIINDAIKNLSGMQATLLGTVGTFLVIWVVVMITKQF